MLLSQLFDYRKFHDQIFTKIIKINKNTKFEHDFNDFDDSLSYKMQRNQNQNEFVRNDYFTFFNIIDFL